MAQLDSFLAVWAPRILSVLRIIAGFLLLQHGLQKLFGYPPPSGPRGPLDTLGWIAAVLEFAGGLMLILGIFTRAVAFILSGLMAVAYFMAHAPGGFWPILNRGELAALYSFVFLYLAFAGGGTWSLDNLLWRRHADISR